MIIVNVIGGLGNQMFQYAAGRALSLKLDEPLGLDISGFASYGLHQGYQLGRAFVCSPEIASTEKVRELIGWRTNRLARRLLLRSGLRFLHGDHLVVEPHFHYWSGIDRISGALYLQGYWQSEKYFAGVTDVIRADFTFRQPLSAANAEVVGRIGQTAAVSLHVRRGDYASNPRTQAAHGLCSPEYYRAAVRYVVERVAAPEFFVFSDDIAWARDNLDIGFPCHYIGHNRGAESYNDMRLMNLCRHHILANSSFSWWGAWLNPRPDKIVVAPGEWFANGNHVEDLFPTGWVTL